MYNKTKRALALTSAILGIIMGAFEIIAGIENILLGADYVGYGYSYSVATGIIIGGVIDFLFGIAIIIIASLYCKKPLLIDGKYVSYKKLNITLLVFDSILFFIYLLNIIMYGTTSALGVIVLILTLVILGMTISTLCLKDNVSETEVVNVAPVTIKEEPASTEVVLTEVKTEADKEEVATVLEANKDEALYTTIKELKHLKDEGVLSEEEFERAVLKATKK